jgi:tRNA G18 (ribose-2'-O)-methylase SpoU
MNVSTPHPRYRSKRSQKGEAELMVFGVVVVIAALISGTVYVLGWVKQNKYSEREKRRRAAIEEKLANRWSGRRDPAEYVALCDKPAWALLQTRYKCDILPESYGELFLRP